MRHFISGTLVAATILAAVSVSRADDGAKIPWQHDLSAARKLAKKEGKGLFIYMTPDWFR